MNTNNSQLYAGAGKCRIEYPENFFPYRGFGPRLLTGIHDDLFVRAAMIANDSDRMIFVSVDTGDLSDRWLPLISEISGAEEDHIFLTATHTHSAPYIDRTIPENVKDSEKTEPYIREFCKALRSAVTSAKDSLQPARIGFGSGTCIANTNRDVHMPDGSFKTGVNTHGPSDHTVEVIKFEDLQGNPIAFINNYAVHSSIMLFTQIKDGGMLTSGDLAGEAMRYVEDHSGAVSLFTMGAAGDQNPLFSACKMSFKNGKPERDDLGSAGFALVKVLGELLGSEILYVSDNITVSDMSPEVSLAASASFVTAPGQKKPEVRPGAPLPEHFEYEDAESVQLRLSMIRINNIVFAGVPGEIMTSIGQDIRHTLCDGKFENAIVMTQCNGSNSYMGDDEAYDLHKFAAMASVMKKGIADILVSGFADIAEKL